MEDGMLTLLILAGVTVFLLFRLKGVLGTKTGAEKPPAPSRRNPAAAPPAPVEDEAAPAAPAEIDEDDPTSVALARMQAVEPGFSAGSFVSGARGAYEMLLMAFENGDKATLQKYLSPDVFQDFAAAIDARADEGLTVDARFIGVRKAEIAGARFDEDDGIAEIDMRFVGEMVTSVRDREHHIVEGDPNEIRREHDTWTFGRKMGAADPNWLLIATGE